MMINKWLIAGLFLVSMFFDGIIFPAFFGFREGLLSVIFIIIMLLRSKINLQDVFLAVVLSGVAEFYWGLKLGALILPLLASVGALFLLSIFFNMRSKIFMVVSGMIAFIVFWESSILVAKIL